MSQFEYVAVCLFGLEKFVSDEIEALGYVRTDTIDGRVTFKGDESAIARFNIFSRYSERLYIKLGDFNATTFTELFDGTKNIPFENFIGSEDQFPVTGSCIRSQLMSVPDCQSIIKKAIVERLKLRYNLNWFPETGTLYKVEFFINKDNVMLMIDTSGTSLHKRGYRPESNAAPLRETLAAAMVKISRPRNDVVLWDPFCGSGTIAIEAAMLMSNMAPGRNRRFISEHFNFINKNHWLLAREEAIDVVDKYTGFQVFASDIDKSCALLAKQNAKRAGVEKFIHVFEKNALDIKKSDTRTTIVCNPPYGERLMDRDSIEQLYRSMGKVFAGLAPWQIYIISSVDDFEKLYGKKADKIRKFYNGKLKCNFYQYFKNKTV